MIDMITATRKAAPNEAKLKLVAPMKKEVILRMAALMTKVNKPSVNKVSGSDKIVRIGLINIFNIDKIKLAIKAVQILSTKIRLGKITVSEINVKVLTMRRWR